MSILADEGLTVLTEEAKLYLGILNIHIATYNTSTYRTKLNPYNIQYKYNLQYIQHAIETYNDNHTTTTSTLNS